MREPEVRLVLLAIGAFSDRFARSEGREFQPGNLEDFAEFARYLRGQRKLRRRRIPQFDLLGTAAICLLWPSLLSPPDRLARMRILLELRRWVPDPARRLKLLPHLLIAYGCGFRRLVLPGVMGPTQPWDRCVNSLKAMVRAMLFEANRRLARIVTRFPLHEFNDPVRLDQIMNELTLAFLYPEDSFDLKAGESLQIKLEAKYTLVLLHGPRRKILTKLLPSARYVFVTQEAMRLKTPKGTIHIPAGFRVVVAAGDDSVRIDVPGLKSGGCHLKQGQAAVWRGPAKLSILACTCGCSKCRSTHRLAAFEPLQHDLLSLVATYLKGPGVSGHKVKRLYAKAFSSGAYYALLARTEF